VDSSLSPPLQVGSGNVLILVCLSVFNRITQKAIGGLMPNLEIDGVEVLRPLLYALT